VSTLGLRKKIGSIPLVTGSRARGRRGSGYRIGQTTVLTAAHVVEDDAAPVVRFDADQPGEWSVTASSRWADAGSDLAVLTIPAPDHMPSVEAVRFGRLGDRDAVVEARAMGFPLFKLKNYDSSEVDREQLPEIVGRLLDRHDARRAARRQTWREHTGAQRAFYERYDHLAADIARTAERGMDRGYGLEL
jgi:hypothetical protein